MEKWRVSHGVKEPYLFLGGLLSRPLPLLLPVFDGQPAFPLLAIYGLLPFLVRLNEFYRIAQNIAKVVKVKVAFAEHACVAAALRRRNLAFVGSDTCHEAEEVFFSFNRDAHFNNVDEADVSHLFFGSQCDEPVSF